MHPEKPIFQVLQPGCNPEFGDPYSAGVDLKVFSISSMGKHPLQPTVTSNTEIFWVLEPGRHYEFDFGVRVFLPEGSVGFIRSRSSIRLNGLYFDGVIDIGYHEPLRCTAFMVSDADPLRIYRFQPVAQIVITQLHPRVWDMQVVRKIQDGIYYNRGGGTGSTNR